VKEAEPDTSSAEADAGVTDADKSDSDSGTPAMMSLVRISRAIGRQIKSLGDARTAILAEAKVAAEAAAVGKVGSKAFLSQFRGEANGDLPFIALMSAHLAVNKDRATAILRAKNDNPAAYNEWEKAGRPMPSKAA
jgi:hypothetical protein